MAWQLPLVWGQLWFHSHKVLEANPKHIWKLRNKANYFQHVSNFILPFYVFYRPDENDLIKLFSLNNSSSANGRVLILHTLTKNYKIYLLAKFQPEQLLTSKIGDFIIPSQCWIFQLQRLTRMAFISWYIFSKRFERTLKRWRHKSVFFSS